MGAIWSFCKKISVKLFELNIQNSPTKTPDFAKMEEELKQLELAENFEAAAELRQKIRDMKREERKRIIRKQKDDENAAQKEKEERLFNKVSLLLAFLQ